MFTHASTDKIKNISNLGVRGFSAQLSERSLELVRFCFQNVRLMEYYNYVVTSTSYIPRYTRRVPWFSKTRSNQQLSFNALLNRSCSIEAIHTLRVHYAHAAANLNSGYSKYAKVARGHYFCTIALQTSRAVLTRA